MAHAPLPIFGRGHSGGRLVCEAFIQNGIDMGKVAPDRKDTDSFSVKNPDVVYLVKHAYDYLTANPQEKYAYQTQLRHCIDNFHNNEIKHQGPFGWKMGITLFMLPMVLDSYPEAKAIHLIRDGRDIMLSRLNARVKKLQYSINRLTVFGDANVTHFQGEILTPETIEKYRTALEMQHWVTAVEYGLYGRRYPERYLEVKYEQVCQNPMIEFERIFNFLAVPFKPECKTWIKNNIYQNRIGKWHDLSEETLKLPLTIGKDLLDKLGYT